MINAPRVSKATGAISKYKVDVVCANLLQSYKREVTLIVADEPGSAHDTPMAKRPRVAVASVQGDEVDEVQNSLHALLVNDGEQLSNIK